MAVGSEPDLTKHLQAWSAGDREAFNALLPLLRRELYQMAQRHMKRERAGHTLQPTALINELYLRLIDGASPIPWKNRTHFLGACAHMMRQILVDYARKHRADKRGGGEEMLPLDEALAFSRARSSELLALEEALLRLAKVDERKSKVVELRFFGGLQNDEIAAVLDISLNTVIRDWTFARAWLSKELVNC